MSSIVRIERPAILDEIPADKPAIIEASAGTGKTFTLEHLVLEKMLTERIAISKILVVTFTERATNELGQRIRAMLEGILTRRRHVEHPDPDKKYWELDDDAMRFVERQLFTFDRAPIHTIHGFCHRILAENAFHLRRLFDQEHQDGRSLFERAFREALRKDLTTEPVLAAYVRGWFELYDEESLESDLYRVCDESGRILPGFSEERLLQALEALRQENEEGLMQRAQTAIRRSVSPDAANLVVQGIGILFARLDSVREVIDIPDLLVALEPFLRAMKENGKQHSDPGVRAVFYAMYRLAPLRVAALQRFRPEVQRRLAETKETGLFDFDDMLQMVSERLDDASGESPLLGYLREQYRVALIDEFQDTDPIQWNIFRRVFFDSAGRNGLYLIGDPKQAIYGFRGADVRTYLDAKERVTARGDLVPLRQNFRSTEGLIEAYNLIFDQEAEEPFFDGPIRYDHPVSCGRPDRIATWANGDDVVPVEIVRPVADRLFAGRIRDALGDAFADEIARILSDEHALYVHDDGEPRRVTARNIFVLTHNNWEGREIAKALRARGVPHAFYKQEGLFQTPEAFAILDLLAAVESPYDRAKRQAAWITPFFEVRLEDLPKCRDLPETHPLFARLVAWHDLAERREFERLFTEISEQSGVIRRAIFLGDNDRALTNIQHIFEVLLEEVMLSHFDLRELLHRLQAFVSRSALPRSDDRNVQRLESDEEAVQIMTVHKSKGLEADVVFLFGGLNRPMSVDIHTLHVEGERAVHVGRPFLPPPQRLIDNEFREEAQRLLYVAATRAVARLYLPYIDKRDLKRPLDGRQVALNKRLETILGTDGFVPDELQGLFRLSLAPYQPPQEPSAPEPIPLDAWTIPEGLLTDADPSRARVAPLAETPLMVTSYSRMKRTAPKSKDDAEPSSISFQTDVHAVSNAWRGDDELPGGATQGIFLHAVLENSPPDSFEETTLDEWRASDEIVHLFDEMMSEHAIDAKYRPHCEWMVWNTMTTPVPLPRGASIDGLWRASKVLHEVEYFFPIPEGSDPRLNELVERAFRVDRGFIKGYIDVVLEIDGVVYFADWKSDTLDRYDDETLAAHVQAQYATQARLYSLAIARMFGLHDQERYDARFGGYLYAFLRGAGPDGSGFYSHRPSFDDLLHYENELARTVFR